MSVRMKRRKAKADHLSQGKPHEFMINSKIGVVHISQCLESIKSLIFNSTLFLAQKIKYKAKQTERTIFWRENMKMRQFWVFSNTMLFLRGFIFSPRPYKARIG